MIEAAIIHYCKYQERCHAEVRTKLYELGCTTPEVEEHIARLIESGMINEERFARAYARGKFRMKQWGREKIKQQLRLKKISDYCIKKAFTEIDADEYVQTLNRLFNKKYNEIKMDRSVPSRKQKLYRFLVQKGYERDIINDMINAFFKK